MMQPQAKQPNPFSRFFTWYRGQRRRVQVGVGCAGLIGACTLCGICGAIGNALPSTSATNTANHGQTTASTSHSSTTSTAAKAASATPAPKATATARPTVAPTATSVPAQPTQPPAQAPTATPVPHLFIQKIAAYATDYSYGEVEVRTLPGAALTITVTYCSGYEATSGSLQGTFYANSQGYQTWTWEPETKCQGPADAYITASWHGQSTDADFGFNVN